MAEPTTLREALAERVALGPDDLAFAEAERHVTYAELDRAAHRLAAGLQREGVRRGDRVALVLPAGVGFAEAFWATQCAGAVPCAINPALPAEARDRRTRQIRPRLVVDAKVASRLHGPSASPRDVADAPDDLAYLQLTSGTSGEPRAAMIRQRNVLAYLRTSGVAHAIGDGDVSVSWVPPWHDLGLVSYMIRPVYEGTPCHIVEPTVRAIPEWLATVSAVRATLTGAPDFALRLAARLVDPETVDLGSLRVVTDGGEAVRASTIDRFRSRFSLGDIISPGYGLAEATLAVSTRRYREPLAVDARGNVSCGPPLPGLEVRAGTHPDIAEEIRVRGETVFAGYFDDEDMSRSVLRDGWLHTGDLGYRAADGQLYVLGRTRAIIKRGGATIAPRELEEAAQEVAGVSVAAAVGLGSASAGGEEIVIVAEVKDLAPGAVAALAVAVATSIRGTTGHSPARVHIVPGRTIPRTANGKLRYGSLKEAVATGAIGESA
jgi:acyl-CoA synthetase (AMP-forming)/AMP-acid ligase II